MVGEPAYGVALKYAQLFGRQKILESRARARAAQCWTCLTLAQEENSASPAVACTRDSGSLMISEALLPNGIFCCCLLWRAQFDEH